MLSSVCPRLSQFSKSSFLQFSCDDHENVFFFLLSSSLNQKKESFTIVYV